MPKDSMIAKEPNMLAEDYWQPYRFSGKELDKQNGLNMYDFGARLFDVAGVPMWISVDPLAEDNPNVTPYMYCAGDPVNKFDPDVIKQAFFSSQWMPTNQAGDTICYTPIITGLKKTDKICYMPHSIYHANLVKRIIENPSLFICGYSFGDFYINQLLQRHKLIHDKNEKVVVVEKWPDYVNDDYLSLYSYFMNNTSGGLKEFVERITEAGIAPLDTF